MPGMLQSMELQRVGLDFMNECNSNKLLIGAELDLGVPHNWVSQATRTLCKAKSCKSNWEGGGLRVGSPVLQPLLFRVFFFFFFFGSSSFFFICSGFCHTLKWNSHGLTCVSHPNPPSHLPLHPLPLGFPSAPGLSACLMHPTWAGDLFHPR